MRAVRSAAQRDQDIHAIVQIVNIVIFHDVHTVFTIGNIDWGITVKSYAPIRHWAFAPDPVTRTDGCILLRLGILLRIGILSVNGFLNGRHRLAACRMQRQN